MKLSTLLEKWTKTLLKIRPPSKMEDKRKLGNLLLEERNGLVFRER